MNPLYNLVERVAHHRSVHGGAPTFEDYGRSRSSDDDGSRLQGRLQTIDSNIASLLTHVSAMIAATGLLLIVFDDEGWTQFFVLMEMLGYCLITVFLVINLPFSNPIPRTQKHIMASTGRKFGSAMEVRYNIYLARRYIYVYSAYGVMVLTMCFALTVLAHIVILSLRFF